MIALKFSLLIISPAVEVNTKTKEKQKTKDGWKSAWYRVCRFPKRVEFFYRHKICWYESFAAYHLLESVSSFLYFWLELGVHTNLWVVTLQLFWPLFWGDIHIHRKGFLKKLVFFICGLFRCFGMSWKKIQQKEKDEYGKCSIYTNCLVEIFLAYFFYPCHSGLLFRPLRNRPHLMYLRIRRADSCFMHKW